MAVHVAAALQGALLGFPLDYFCPRAQFCPAVWVRPGASLAAALLLVARTGVRHGVRLLVRVPASLLHAALRRTAGRASPRWAPTLGDRRELVGELCVQHPAFPRPGISFTFSGGCGSTGGFFAKTPASGEHRQQLCRLAKLDGQERKARSLPSVLRAWEKVCSFCIAGKAGACSGAAAGARDGARSRAGGGAPPCVPATVPPAPRQRSSLSGSTAPACSLHNFNYA